MPFVLSKYLIVLIVLFVRALALERSCFINDKNKLEQRYRERLKVWKEFDQTRLTEANSIAMNLTFSNNCQIKAKKTQCDLTYIGFLTKSLTEINHLSTCQSSTRLYKRRDKYPFFREQTECSCDDCGKLYKKAAPRGNYMCSPILQWEPILERKDCEWTSSKELVSSGCTCVWNPTFQSF
jgi:hypothetical protein